MRKIYFDYAASTPTDPEIVKIMEPYFFDHFGNPSSAHSFGREANKAVEDARESMAAWIGAKPSEIIFTSGATEANNHAILGTARCHKNQGRHIIVSKIEHHSVLEPIKYLEKEGYQVTYLNVDQRGMVNPEEIKKAITDKTILICVMHASNEIGTIQPVEQIGQCAREHHIPFLIDAVQTVGHIPLNVNDLKADFLSLSAHKFYGPKGVGALYIREGTQIANYLMGGHQERGHRASTQNVAGIVGLSKAMEICHKKMQADTELQTRLRNRLMDQIPKLVDGTVINGDPTNRLPNNAHFSFEKVQGEAILMSLDMVGIAASMGSSCTSGALEPSHVLRATGLPDALALGSLRITVGRWTTPDDIDYLLEQLPQIVHRLRQ